MVKKKKKKKIHLTLNVFQKHRSKGIFIGRGAVSFSSNPRNFHFFCLQRRVLESTNVRAYLISGKLNTRKMGDSRRGPFLRYWNFCLSVLSVFLRLPPIAKWSFILSFDSPLSSTLPLRSSSPFSRCRARSPPSSLFFHDILRPALLLHPLYIYVPIDRYVGVCIYIDTVTPPAEMPNI